MSEIVRIELSVSGCLKVYICLFIVASTNGVQYCSLVGARFLESTSFLIYSRAMRGTSFRSAALCSQSFIMQIRGLPRQRDFPFNIEKMLNLLQREGRDLELVSPRFHPFWRVRLDRCALKLVAPQSQNGRVEFSKRSAIIMNTINICQKTPQDVFLRCLDLKSITLKSVLASSPKFKRKTYELRVDTGEQNEPTHCTDSARHR